MNTNDLNTALYEKMAAEQDKYRDWLKSQYITAKLLNGITTVLFALFFSKII